MITALAASTLGPATSGVSGRQVPSGPTGLAASVQGVVVQMATSTRTAPRVAAGRAMRAASSARTVTRNATSIAGEIFSSYSTSASASAERQSRHQYTGFTPL